MEIENEIVEKGVWYDIGEEARTYHFAGGDIHTVLNTRRLKVSERGTHYVMDMNDVLHIINHTWLAIKVTE